MSTPGRTIANLRKVGIKALRTRWVDFKVHDYDSAQVEPGWHAWLGYMVDKPPTEDALLQTKTRKWEVPHVLPNFTATPGAYKSYNT
ncbi:uncharacterized protein N0V96_003554 [Colletotrichum fioriniae]|uniref:uncharacterized protein n=1 Tax=Colletotrichum fioriniae TaxID=710243 RepID=UPI0032DA7888|nr:hypothetical protein N0V96_003554 [Colletotrichum fioriniae]